MANFMDLPKPVREKIYRLHLIAEEQPITRRDYKMTCGHNRHHAVRDKAIDRKMPHLFHVSKKIEREASRIYFGENTFAFEGPEDLLEWQRFAWPRHIHQITRVELVRWCELSPVAANEAFTRLGELPRLESLCVRFDERDQLHRMLLFDPIIRCGGRSTIGPQINLQLLRLPGLQGFRSIREIRELKFWSVDEVKDEIIDGAMPGGLFASIRREILGQVHARTKYEHQPFRFLDLPPEVRNIVYGMLLSFPGATYPVADEPVSITSQYKYQSWRSRNALTTPGSALNVLLANRQVHDEAYAFFYRNDLFFPTPARLQIFMLSLGNNRLDCLRSLTLFNEHGHLAEGCPPQIVRKKRNDDYGLEGTNKMEVVMLLIRRLPNLQKLHFLYRSATMSSVGFWDGGEVCDVECKLQPSDISFLFQMRNIPDIQVRDLDLELDEELDNYGGWTDTNKQKDVLRHLNYGLRLAQKSIVVRDLFAGRDWRKDEIWPVLQGSDCGFSKGCTCGPNED